MADILLVTFSIGKNRVLCYWWGVNSNRGYILKVRYWSKFLFK